MLTYTVNAQSMTIHGGFPGKCLSNQVSLDSKSAKPQSTVPLPDGFLSSSLSLFRSHII